MGNWSDLQDDMLYLIAQHLTKIEDYVRFGAVCTSWRAAAASKKDFKGLVLWQNIPCLMLPPQDDDNHVDREFYSLMERQVVAKVSIPKLEGKIQCFESLGWLLAIGQAGDMILLHPFLDKEIKLPHRNTFPEYDLYETVPEIFVEKMVLSAMPCETEDYVVMLICGSVRYLAFWKPGDQCWNRIETRNSTYDDVVCYNGQFYAIDHLGNVVVCDVSGPNPKGALVIARFSPELCHKREVYIVESPSPDKQSSLILVTRDNVPDHEGNQGVELEYPVYCTTEFKVYELDLLRVGEETKWKEIKNLGSRALFLGHAASISLEVSAAKLAPGIKPNHIYFTDDCWPGYVENPEGGGKDMGVYNLETGTIEAFYDGSRQLLSRICPSFWITPHF